LLLSPSNVSALYGRGLAQQKLGRMNQAIEDYTKVMELDSGHVNAAYARAACYNSKGLFAKAIDDYNLALTKDQDKLSSSNAKRIEERRRRTSSLTDSPYSLLRQVLICVVRAIVGAGA
jgi:tetratricopeptide (TPR) repeat protein